MPDLNSGKGLERSRLRSLSAHLLAGVKPGPAGFGGITRSEGGQIDPQMEEGRAAFPLRPAGESGKSRATVQASVWLEPSVSAPC